MLAELLLITNKVAWGWFSVRVWFLSNLPKNPTRVKPVLSRRK